ncbi:hypothetical protein A2397_04935 [Candidatus Amesbacteria bacterium RIFOXYB1_FULL_44_23]|uniref:Uncharacterized protein n=1 Tax=Candidatus Amesbacteria bacterium RIFOXYB1_FULL_44_23 TaxID=1797263 RepID=A0A1F4ZSC7_9BACT|nr:MAG: hypothetical protein A2397_04935 [Candidatus Amesbacteria bacterium RIFOXYB1_FULL_44_23]
MDNQTTMSLIVLGLPSLVMVICWISLMVTMSKTTGELKLFLSPNNLVKIFAIYLVIVGTLLLGLLKIIEGQTIGVIFSGIIGYTIGHKFENKE